MTGWQGRRQTAWPNGCWSVPLDRATHAAVLPLAEVRPVPRNIGWGHGSEYRELAAVGAYWSGKDGQRCEAHCDHVACPSGTGGI